MGNLQGYHVCDKRFRWSLCRLGVDYRNLPHFAKQHHASSTDAPILNRISASKETFFFDHAFVQQYSGVRKCLKVVS